MASRVTNSVFTDLDRAQLAERGLTVDEALAQLARIADPPASVVVDRPCTIGDGIRRLTPADTDAMRARHEAAVAAGRYTTFVPASGAATRMFQELLAWRERPGPLPFDELEHALAADSPDALGVRVFLDGLPRFAFSEALVAVLARLAPDGPTLDQLASAGPLRPLLEALLGPRGLDYARTPKGLIPFHRDRDHARTAFEEHWVEAADAMGDASGRSRLHATVSPEHEARFAEAVTSVRARLEPQLGRTFDVGLSVQGRATDTLSLGADGRPFREADGRLLFRPAGHGALLPNLAALGADLVFMKNIDNVASDSHKAPTYEAFAQLSGLLLDLEERLHAAIAGLATGEATREAVAFAREAFGRTVPAAVAEDPEELARWLERPIRVCGMVPNTGEPGGGPYWVRERDGDVTLQIVESSQVRRDDASQRAAFAASTHFNPVFLVGALRDARGAAHDLASFVDEDAVIVTLKSSGGRELRALERPGLWNGAMAGWHTVFVEVPLTIFNPVKTVRDLLRPEHQANS